MPKLMKKKEDVEPLSVIEKWWLQSGYCPNCHSFRHKAISTPHIAKAYECLDCGCKWEEV